MTDGAGDEDDDELKINTLHRFAKQPTRLVLHEYSHCEVPAGCGGVILRWIDPADGQPASTRLTNALGRIWLDGQELASSLTLLRGGAHVLALELAPTTTGDQLWSFAASFDADEAADVIAAGTPVWRGTGEDVADGWTAPAFDDAAWPALVAVARAALAAATLEPWAHRTLTQALDAGTSVFGFDGPRLRVRVTFHVPEAP